MALCIRDGGTKTKPMVSVGLFTATETCTMVCGKRTNLTVREFMYTKMELAMKELGKQISSMDLVWRHLLTGQNMRASTLMV